MATRFSGAIAVALVGVYASFWHISEAALAAGQRADIAYLMPVAIDGLMGICGVYAMAAGMTIPTRVVAYAGFVGAWCASLWANVTSAGSTASHGDQLVAAWPAIAVAIAALVIHLGSHKPRRKPAKTKAPAAPRTPRQVPVPVSPATVPLELLPGTWSTDHNYR